ncbi:MAG: ferredoxin [Pseudomonadota bacterium]|nr:ferredoxin [Pseudomonadota bacterium]
MYRVIINEKLCIGSSNCMEEAPDAYEVDERGIAVLVASSQPSDEALLRGARACPVDAIQLFDEAGRRVHP